jgi:FkbM family methyltransferase
MDKNVVGYWMSLARSCTKGLRAKARVVVSGVSPVPLSCQIPDLRQKYRELGLAPKRGVFVEVGGFDGETYSNTSFLADQGWLGLYIEPIEAYCAQIKARHATNRVTVEALAVTDRAGTAELNTMGPLTTLNAATLEAYKLIPWAQASACESAKVLVVTATLGTVLERNAIPHDFDLMVIDVEGGEEAIVESLLLSRWRPRVLIVELCDVHPDFTASPELQASHRDTREALITNGYKPFYVDEINSIFAYYPLKSAEN